MFSALHSPCDGLFVNLLSVGLGSDFDGIGSTPEGLEDVSKYPALVSIPDQCDGLQC